MARMLNLGNIFELVDDGLQNGTLVGKQLISEAHQLVLHVAPGLGKKTQCHKSGVALRPIFSRHNTSVCKYLAKEPLKQVFDWLSVI